MDFFFTFLEILLYCQVINLVFSCFLRSSVSFFGPKNYVFYLSLPYLLIWFSYLQQDMIFR